MVDRERPARGFRPRELLRPLLSRSHQSLAVGEGALDGRRQLIRLGVHRSVARDLSQRRIGREDHRRPARHRLHDGKAEALVA